MGFQKSGDGGVPPPYIGSRDYVDSIVYKETIFFNPHLSIMNQLRCSRRLRGLRPEIPNTRYRCFCLLEGDACLGGAIQLECCRQFLHQSCFRQWNRTHDTCPLCRQEPARQAPRPAPLDAGAADAAAAAAVDRNDPPPRRPNLEDMSNQEVIARLEGLLDIDVLRHELERVSTHFFCLDESGMGIEKGILYIHRLIVEGDIDLFHCIELDVDCPSMCDDEKQSIQRLFNIMIPRPYRWLRPPRRNSNINFLPRHRSRIPPPRLDGFDPFVYDDQRILLELHFVRYYRPVTVGELVFSLRFHRYRPHYI